MLFLKTFVANDAAIVLAQVDGTSRYVIAAAIVVPAFVLAFLRSSYLLDCLIFVMVFNRQLRRILDWNDGAFDPTPVISLTPLMIGAAAFAVVVTDHRSLPYALKRSAYYFAAALGLGFAVGIRSGPSAIYGAANYVLPLSTLFYAYLCRPSAADVDRWMRTVATCALISACYGIIQWAVVPDWDRQWVEWSGMISSMGRPMPFNLSIPATLASRGPAGWFFASAALVMLVNPAWRKPWGLPAIVAIILAMLLTRVRSAAGYLLITLFIVALINRGAVARQIISCAIACIVGLYFLLPFIPESGQISDRLESLLSLHEDASFQGRVDIARYGFSEVISRPWGLGVGSATTVATKFAGQSVMWVFDNGWLSLMTELGLIGTALFLQGVFSFAKYVQALSRLRFAVLPGVTLGFGMLVGVFVFMLISNLFTSDMLILMWIPLGGSAYLMDAELDISYDSIGIVSPNEVDEHSTGEMT